MVLQSKLNFLEERLQSTIYFLGFKKKEFEFFWGGGGIFSCQLLGVKGLIRVT